MDNDIAVPHDLLAACLGALETAAVFERPSEDVKLCMAQLRAHLGLTDPEARPEVAPTETESP